MQRKVIGHRGLGPTHTLGARDFNRQSYPENSLAAFKEALVSGADGIEVDVLLTKDGILIALHGKDIWNYTGEKELEAGRLVIDYNYEKIGTLDIGGGHYPPQIGQVLDLLAEQYARTGKNYIINFDIKEPRTIGVLLPALSKYFEKGSIKQENVFLCSYQWNVLRNARKISSDIQLAACLKTAELFGEDGFKMPGYIPIKDHYSPSAIQNINSLHDEIGLYAVDCALRDVRPELIQFAAKNGLGLAISTGNDRVGASEIDFQQIASFFQDICPPLLIFKADEPDRAKAGLEIVFETPASP